MRELCGQGIVCALWLVASAGWAQSPDASSSEAGGLESGSRRADPLRAEGLAELAGRSSDPPNAPTQSNRGHDDDVESLAPTAQPREESSSRTGFFSITDGFKPGQSVQRTEASPLNWVLGGLLLAGSAPFLGYAINTLVREGECVRTFGDGCATRIRFREGAGLFLVAGLGFAIAGFAVFIGQPVRLRVEAGTSSARMKLEGRF